MAAIIGRRDVMQAAQSTFCSSTYWTDRIGPTAAIATIRKHRRCNVGEHLVRIGRKVQEGWRSAAEAAGIKVEVGGMPPLSHFGFVHELKQEAKTLFTQLMLKRGFLATTAFYSTFAHTDEHVEQYLAAVKEVFGIVAEALQKGNVTALLKGPWHTRVSRD